MGIVRSAHARPGRRREHQGAGPSTGRTVPDDYEEPADRRNSAATKAELIAAALRLLADSRPVMVPNVRLNEAMATA